jgi:myo-inositol-1(or 4)-monophosphatase
VDNSSLLSLAIDCAHDAGSLLYERFRGPARGVDTKSSATDLVSDADRDSEQLIISRIAADRPEDGVLGEEGAGRESTSGLTWVIDPLDATVNYLFGIPWWCVCVAVQDAGGDLVGVVHQPLLGETFTGIRGEGAWLNGEAISVSAQTDIAQALIATGFAYQPEARRVQSDAVVRVLPAARDIRRMGSAALDLCSLACGRVDGFFESHLEEWDKAAGRLIVREAGGVVEDLPAPIPQITGGVIASNGKIHEQLRSLVGGE